MKESNKPQTRCELLKEIRNCTGHAHKAMGNAMAILLTSSTPTELILRQGLTQAWTRLWSFNGTELKALAAHVEHFATQSPGTAIDEYPIGRAIGEALTALDHIVSNLSLAQTSPARQEVQSALSFLSRTRAALESTRIAL